MDTYSVLKVFVEKNAYLLTKFKLSIPKTMPLSIIFISEDVYKTKTLPLSMP